MPESNDLTVVLSVDPTKFRATLVAMNDAFDAFGRVAGLWFEASQEIKAALKRFDEAMAQPDD